MEAVEGRVAARLEAVEGRLATIETTLLAMDDRLVRLVETLNAIHGRLDVLDRVNQIVSRWS